MKIALICSDTASGGLIKYIDQFVKVKTQHEVVLFCGKNLNIKNSDYITIKKNNFSLERGRDLFFNKKLNKNLIVMIDRFNPDIVIFMNGYIRRGLEKYKTISILHNQLTINKNLLFKQRPFKLIISLLIARKAVIYSLKKANGIIFLSKASKQETDKYGYKYNDGIVIKFGHDMALLHNNYNDEKSQMIYVSTFYPYKNHNKLVESLVELKKYTNNFHLNLIGFVPSDSFRRKIKKLGLSKYITFYGWLTHDQTIELILQSNIYIHSSLIESTGNGVLEGVVVGNTIVCSNINVFKETLGDNAIYFDPHDVNSITNALIRAIKEPKILNKEYCEKIIKNHNYIDSVSDVYKYAEKIAKQEIYVKKRY